MHYPTTPDERYFVVKGRLWRCSNPGLDPEERSSLVKDLMNARRAVRHALNSEDELALKTAREQVNTAKVALGERGAVWWTDGAPDFNRKLVKNTPYADWHATIAGSHITCVDA
ncbi:hypothetical protein C7B65_22295 [Phormidesmis priestleyi ULC007]|uniref:Uncharacterized protein n=1 Tax=Phormidesmis priestleyi ULC007 TaxID=1920490 RepID=A0A2T1D733_9CYAN|nr:hypothetical protein [Phormidesmis priestleyi]PSB16256.1 hypothetical protein C7B65_22295 [Phormidesmis priestleyi ULC007]PZO46864.1 MAG: hypothetical protein DCF14_21435 [Phormidesmis priestleyi]